MKYKLIIVCLFCFVLLFSLIGCSSNETTSNIDSSSYEDYEEQAQEETSQEVNLFNYLEITNVSSSYNDISSWYKIRGEIKNTYHKTLEGYLRVTVYDDNNNIVDSCLIALPVNGLSPGESFVFDKSVSQEPFSKYKFTDSSIIEEL